MTFKLSFNDYYSLDISNKIKAVKHRKAEKRRVLFNLCTVWIQKRYRNKKSFNY